MLPHILLKASQEKADFFELIGTDVTFASELITVGGQISHKRGKKAFISDVEYIPGYWSNLCPDIYVEPKINTFRINGINARCYKPDTFVEHRKMLSQ